MVSEHAALSAGKFHLGCRHHGFATRSACAFPPQCLGKGVLTPLLHYGRLANKSPWSRPCLTIKRFWRATPVLTVTTKGSPWRLPIGLSCAAAVARTCWERRSRCPCGRPTRPMRRGCGEFHANFRLTHSPHTGDCHPSTYPLPWPEASPQRMTAPILPRATQRARGPSTDVSRVPFHIAAARAGHRPPCLRIGRRAAIEDAAPRLGCDRSWMRPSHLRELARRSRNCGIKRGERGSRFLLRFSIFCVLAVFTMLFTLIRSNSAASCCLVPGLVPGGCSGRPPRRL